MHCSRPSSLFPLFQRFLKRNPHEEILVPILPADRGVAVVRLFFFREFQKLLHLFRKPRQIGIQPVAGEFPVSESQQERYDREVADYTAEFVHSSKGDMDSFRLKIGKLAEDSGIANWQDDKATYVAIGKGLRKADLSQPQYEAFKKSLGDAEGWKMDAIAEGFKK